VGNVEEDETMEFKPPKIDYEADTPILERKDNEDDTVDFETLTGTQVAELRDQAKTERDRKHISFFDITRVLGRGGQGMVYEARFNVNKFHEICSENPKDDDYITAKREDIQLIQQFFENSDEVEPLIQKMIHHRQERLSADAQREKNHTIERLIRSYALITGKPNLALEDLVHTPIAIKTVLDTSMKRHYGFTDLSGEATIDASGTTPEGRFKKEHEIMEALKAFSVTTPIIFGIEDRQFFMAMEKIDNDLKNHMSEMTRAHYESRGVAFGDLEHISFSDLKMEMVDRAYAELNAEGVDFDATEWKGVPVDQLKLERKMEYYEKLEAMGLELGDKNFEWMPLKPMELEEFYTLTVSINCSGAP